MDLLGSDILRANLRVRFCLGVEDPGEVALALGLGGKKGWPPELLTAPGKFYLRTHSQGPTPGPPAAIWPPPPRSTSSPPTTPTPQLSWTQSPPRRPPATPPPPPPGRQPSHPARRPGPRRPDAAQPGRLDSS
jgi:hypothetical protein